MAKSERMTVVLPEQIASQIRAAVDAGDYASTSEAVVDALRLWTDYRPQPEPSVEYLRRAWDAGKASGLHGTLDFDQLRDEARRRLDDMDHDLTRSGRHCLL